MERIPSPTKGIVMNPIITRLTTRSRARLGSTMALIVALPMGAVLGLSAPAANAAEPAPGASSATSAPAAERAGAPAGNAVPWISDRAAKAAAAGAAGDQFDALVFSKTAAFRHANIPDATAAIQQLGVDNNFTVTVTEDATAFTDANLEQYEVVIF